MYGRCLVFHADHMRQGQSRHRVMVFGLVLNDTEWINNEPGRSWTTWISVFSKISQNHRQQAKKKMIHYSWSKPVSTSMSILNAISSFISHSYIRYNCISTHFQIRSVNTPSKHKGFEVGQSFHSRMCGDGAVVSASVKRRRGQVRRKDCETHESRDGANCLL